MRPSIRWPLVALVALLAFLVPLVGVGQIDAALAVDVALLGVAASGLNLMFGYTGMLSLGHGAFLGLGAYGLGIMVQEWGWAPEVSVLVSVAVSTFISLLVGLLFVRLAGFYFGVATLGLAVALEGLVRAYPNVTGGASGLTIDRRLDLGPVAIVSDKAWFVFAFVVAALVSLFLWWLVAGRTGRLLRLVHRDQLVAAVYGVDVPRVRLAVFVMASSLTSLAGALLFLWRGVVVPESGGLIQSVELVGITVVGGAGYAVGAFVGALGIELIQTAVQNFGEYEQLTYGLTFLLVVFFLQRGLTGTIGGLLRSALRGLELTETSEEPAPVDSEDLGFERSVADLERWAQSASDGGLQVEKVTRRFGGVVAVSEASLVAPTGAITGLIGSNGAGKSTLLNLISGVEMPDAGRIVLEGADLAPVPPAGRARLGLVRTFQVPRLVDELSVVENVALNHDAAHGSVFRKKGSSESIELARLALARAGMGHLAERRAGTLGTGERKFVELVRALLGEPTVLLMDEPAVGLSTGEIARLRKWLLQLRESGTAIVLVDHNLDFIGEVVDFVYEMSNGVVTPRGAPERGPQQRAQASGGTR